jgi:membrane associated rhomboid family serine protease
MFPIHDDTERMHGRPWLTYGIIGINVIVFIWQVITTGMFSNEEAVTEMFLTYGSVPNLLFDDFPASAPTIITSMFMHGSIPHIIGNMVFLFVFGDNIEDRFGRLKFLAIYLAWGAVAALAHSAFAVSTGEGNIPAVGASGAISGVLGAYLVMYPRAKILTALAIFFIYFVRIPVLIYIPFWFVMQVIFTLFGLLNPLAQDSVAYLAHIGGFAAGAAAGLAWRALPDSLKYSGAQQSAASNVKPSFRNPLGRKERPRIEDVSPVIPEVIEGPDYFEVIAEIRGVANASEISARYEPDTRQVRITAHGSKKYDLFAKMPESAVNPVVQYVHYLNGIARVRLTKQ